MTQDEAIVEKIQPMSDERLEEIREFLAPQEFEYVMPVIDWARELLRELDRLRGERFSNKINDVKDKPLVEDYEVEANKPNHKLFDKCSQCGYKFKAGDTITFRGEQEKEVICKDCAKRKI